MRTVDLLCIGCLTFCAVSCVPTRAPVVLSCTQASHCPADGRTRCDLTTQRCVPCEGACPSAAASQDTTSSRASAAEDVSDASSAPDATTDSDAADDSAPLTSCAGKCGQYLGDDADCNCDAMCSEYGDCCSDYDSVCADAGASDAVSGDTDTAGGDDSVAVDAP